MATTEPTDKTCLTKNKSNLKVTRVNNFCLIDSYKNLNKLMALRQKDLSVCKSI